MPARPWRNMVWSSASSTLIGPFVIWFSPNTPRCAPLVRPEGIVSSTPFRATDVRPFDVVGHIPTVLRASSSAIHRSAWKGNSANFADTEFSEVRATLRRLFFLRTDHQHWAVGMAHNRVRYAAHQRSAHSAEPPTPHHDQVRSELLGQGQDLQIHLPHPEVSPCHGAPGGLYPPGLFPEQHPGHLFDLIVEPAFVAERPGIALQESGHHSDVNHVQLGVGCIGQVHGPQGGQLGFFGAVGSEQDSRREDAHRVTLLSRGHPIEGPVLIVSRQWFVTRERRWHDIVSARLQGLIHPIAWKGYSQKSICSIVQRTPVLRQNRPLLKLRGPDL